MIWKVFCFTIVVPLPLKKRLAIMRDDRQATWKLGTAYRIPLMIYPSKRQNQTGVEQ